MSKIYLIENGSGSAFMAINGTNVEIGKVENVYATIDQKIYGSKVVSERYYGKLYVSFINNCYAKFMNLMSFDSEFTIHIVKDDNGYKDVDLIYCTPDSINLCEINQPLNFTFNEYK